ncbi:MAG: CopG family transcriptional regulator [Candidatus Dormibacteria bacterium]
MGMAMTLRLDDQQNDDLRHQAEVEQRSMHAVAQDAIREYIERRAHNTRVRRAIDRVVTDEATVLRRLGES